MTDRLWLQAPFANRFNRFRKVNGHLFQGRYKSVLLETGCDARLAERLFLGAPTAASRNPSRYRKSIRDPAWKCMMSISAT